MRCRKVIPILCFVPSLMAQTPAKGVSELKAFYAANCVKCHGADGAALGADGKKLGGRDFTNAKKMARESDADLVKTIRKGIFFGKVMPSYQEQLTEAEILLLVQEILRKAEKGKVIAP